MWTDSGMFRDEIPYETNHRPKTETRKPKTANRKQQTEDRNPRTKNRKPKTKPHQNRSTFPGGERPVNWDVYAMLKEDKTQRPTVLATPPPVIFFNCQWS